MDTLLLVVIFGITCLVPLAVMFFMAWRVRRESEVEKEDALMFLSEDTRENLELILEYLAGLQKLVQAHKAELSAFKDKGDREAVHRFMLEFYKKYAAPPSQEIEMNVFEYVMLTAFSGELDEALDVAVAHMEKSAKHYEQVAELERSMEEKPLEAANIRAEIARLNQEFRVEKDRTMDRIMAWYMESAASDALAE